MIFLRNFILFLGFIYTKTLNYDASFVFSGVVIILAGVVSCGVPVVEKFYGKKLTDDHGNRWNDDDEYNERKLEDIMEGLAEHESSIRADSASPPPFQSSRA